MTMTAPSRKKCKRRVCHFVVELAKYVGYLEWDDKNLTAACERIVDLIDYTGKNIYSVQII